MDSFNNGSTGRLPPSSREIPLSAGDSSAEALEEAFLMGSTPPTISFFESIIREREQQQTEQNDKSTIASASAASVSNNNVNNIQTTHITNAHVTTAHSTNTGTTHSHPVETTPLRNNTTTTVNTTPSPSTATTSSHSLQRPFSPGIPRPPSADWTLRLFRLEDFIFGKTVGTGTFGRVRLVRLRQHEKFFAMKIMAKTDIIRLHQVDHIFSEKFLLSRLACPFIIRLYSTFQDETYLYMLLEYAIGGELFTYLRRAGRFSISSTRFYASQIVLALEYLHSLGIVYRDLKPENLLLDARGNLKIADFGFAKVIPDNRTWTLCGTPEYLAPEIIIGRGHGRPVDWWALGVLIYEMAAGYPPYYDETPFQIYEKILAGRLEFPDHFDEPLKDLLTGLLIADPARRLGCGVGGAEDVKSHVWFTGVDWISVQKREVPAPFIPPFKHAGDTGNFEEYPEDDFGNSNNDQLNGNQERSIFIEF